MRTTPSLLVTVDAEFSITSQGVGLLVTDRSRVRFSGPRRCGTRVGPLAVGGVAAAAAAPVTAEEVVATVEEAGAAGAVGSVRSGIASCFLGVPRELDDGPSVFV